MNKVVTNHKILYKVQQVFPSEQLLARLGGLANSGGGLIIPQGQHKLPFSFKLPFNNACSDPDWCTSNREHV